MTKGTHMLGGAVSAMLFNLPIIPAVIGSTIPDVDLKLGFPKRRTLFNAHRGITHHPLICLFLLALPFLTVKSHPLIFRNLLSLSVGYTSHIILDLLNPLGIPIFGYSNRLSLKLVRSGRLGEVIVFLILLTLTLLLFREMGFSLKSIIGSGNISFISSLVKSLKPLEVSG